MLGPDAHLDALRGVRAKNASLVSNYIWQFPDVRLRPFDPAKDRPHSSREGARTAPDADDLPVKYQGLLSGIQ
jgi:hypothetical protein